MRKLKRLLVHKDIEKYGVQKDTRCEEKERHILSPMRNGPISAHCGQRYQDQFDAVRDILMSDVEQVDQKLNYMNLPDYLFDLGRRTS